MYGVIEMPEFPLQALLRFRPELRSAMQGPMAALDESGDQSHVVAVNRIAREAGVREGMRPPQALARCGKLYMEVRSAEAEAAAGRLLLLMGWTVTPVVEATSPGRVTLDLHGVVRQCDRATGLEAVCARGKTAGMFLRAGLAGTPDHAAWASLQGRPVHVVGEPEDFLEGLPLEVAGFTERQRTVLAGWGVRTLAAFRRLPRDAVARRMGRDGIRILDRINGSECRLLQPAAEIPSFERKEEFDFRIETLEALLFILRRYVDELELELGAAYRAAEACSLRLQLESGTPYERTVVLPEPSSRADTFFRVVTGVLETVTTQSAVCGVSLSLQTVLVRHRQGDLFAVAMEDAAAFAQTADRLAVMVGEDCLGRPRLLDTWRPDAFRMERLPEDGVFPGEPDICEQAGLPLQRLRPPEPLRVWCSEGKPAAIGGAGISGTVCSCRGPWRNSGGWWTEAPWSREEWDIELEEGGLYRIYREGGQWFLEGAYG